MNNEKPTVAILYIATGRYTVFWEPFYRSAEKYLLPDCDKHYFLFTDNQDLLGQHSQYNNMTLIEQAALEWPYSTLMRFKIFLGIKDNLKLFDYIYYINANTEILDYITEDELLPTAQNQTLTLCIQPHNFHKNRNKYPYDRNPKSTAYIPFDKGLYYFTGALNGGRSEAYLQMCETLDNNIDCDLSNDVIAAWHDESHLNHYALDRKDIKVLPPYFTRGETEYWKTKSKIMFSDKTHYRFGGHAYLRCETDEKISKDEWEKKNARPRKRISFRLKQYIKSFFY